jgi:hypothetical protein
MKLYLLRTVRLSIIRSLFTVHSAMVYVIQVCRQLSSRNRMELQFYPGSVRKLSTNLYVVCCCLFSWRYNHCSCIFHSTVAGFSPLVFEVS